MLKLVANYFKLSYQLLKYSFIKNQYNYIFQTFLLYLGMTHRYYKIICKNVNFFSN